MIFEKGTSCRNNMIWIQFNHLSIWSLRLYKAVIFEFASIFILSGRNVNRKTLIWQIRIIGPCSKLNIVMFSIAINGHHTLTVFIWVLSITWTSNGHRIILFLIKIRNIHLCILRLIDRLCPIVPTFRPRSSQTLFLPNSKRIWNDLNRLLGSLVISSVHLTRLALIRLSVMSW